MPAIRYKWGGGFDGPVANGKLQTKWGGGWFVPTVIYAKSGALGTGGWVDTGYRGYPNPPQGIWVHAWNFGAVALGFSGPAAGGAPVAAYQLVQTDSAGNWLSQVEVGGSPWGNFGVGEDGYYQFYVRSKSAAGLYSNFVGPLRVRIGHTEQGYWQTEGRTQYWSSEHVSGARNRDDPFWIGHGGDCVLQTMHWRNLRTGGMSGTVSPWGSRTVNYIFNGGDFGAINGELGEILNGHSYDKGGFGHTGTGAGWGLVARGSGWSTVSNGYYMLWLDDFWCDGYQNYNVNVYYITRYYQDNGYW